MIQKERSTTISYLLILLSIKVTAIQRYLCFFFVLLFLFHIFNHFVHIKQIIKALCDQAQKLTLSSRAFHNSVFGPWAKFVTDYFGYECVLPMNTGAEAVETGIKV